MTEKSATALSYTYINLVANTIKELLDNDITFSVLVTKNPETIELLPPDFYGDKEALMFNISEWAFEEAEMDNYSFITMIAIDGPNGETGEFTLSVPFMSIKAIVINDLNMVMVSRPFEIKAIEQHQASSESSEPQTHGSTYSEKHLQFEKTSADGIVHSMSKLKLCTSGD